MKPIIFVFYLDEGQPIAVNIAAIKSFEPHEAEGKPARTRVDFGADGRSVTLSVSFDRMIATLRSAGLAH